MHPTIIIVDFDRKTNRLIRNTLNGKYDVEYFTEFSDGYSRITSMPNEFVIIIDPMFPKKEGINFIKSVREWSDCPIIAVSENGTEHAAVTAIDAGADDYIRKPFFQNELLSRIESSIRRFSLLETAKGVDNSPIYKNGELVFNIENHTLIISGVPIHLTKNEFKILSVLCRYSGKVLTNDFLIKSVWGPRNASNTGILRVNITNLRKKIEKDPLNPKYIITENGIGYKAMQNESINPS